MFIKSRKAKNFLIELIRIFSLIHKDISGKYFSHTNYFGYMTVLVSFLLNYSKMLENCEYDYYSPKAPITYYTNKKLKKELFYKIKNKITNSNKYRLMQFIRGETINYTERQCLPPKKLLKLNKKSVKENFNVHIRVNLLSTYFNTIFQEDLLKLKKKLNLRLNYYSFYKQLLSLNKFSIDVKKKQKSIINKSLKKYFLKKKNLKSNMLFTKFSILHNTNIYDTYYNVKIKIKNEKEFIKNYLEKNKFKKKPLKILRTSLPTMYKMKASFIKKKKMLQSSLLEIIKKSEIEKVYEKKLTFKSEFYTPSKVYFMELYDKSLRIKDELWQYHIHKFIKDSLTLNMKNKVYIQNPGKDACWKDFVKRKTQIKKNMKMLQRLDFFVYMYKFEKEEKHVPIKIKFFKKTIFKKIKLIKKAKFLKITKKFLKEIPNTEIVNYKNVKRSFYKYNKLKKIFKQKAFSIYININHIRNYYKTKLRNNIIFNYMYLNEQVSAHYSVTLLQKNKHIETDIKSYLLKDIQLYSDSSKSLSSKDEINSYDNSVNFEKSKKKTYFFNSWRGYLTTWKNSRLFHWNIYKQGTLKTRRYRNFLPPFLKKEKIEIDIIIKYFSFKFQLSNLFWKQFSQMYLFFYDKILIIKKIFQIPINLLFWNFLNFIRNNHYKIKKKLQSWFYRNIRIRSTFWMEIKKNTPKFFDKQIFIFKKIKNAIQYDFLTNYFCVIKHCEAYEKLHDYIFNNKMLKMHNFRYKC